MRLGMWRNGRRAWLRAKSRLLGGGSTPLIPTKDHFSWFSSRYIICLLTHRPHLRNIFIGSRYDSAHGMTALMSDDDQNNAIKLPGLQLAAWPSFNVSKRGRHIKHLISPPDTSVLRRALLLGRAL